MPANPPPLASRLPAILKTVLVVLGCLILAVGSVLWVAVLMDSLFDYRSPLSHSPPQPGEGYGVRSTRRVVIVLVDALREDTALDPQVMPFLDSLRQTGAAATMHSRPPSYSQPGYTTLLTGAWPDINGGPAVNLDTTAIPTFAQDDLFSAARRAGLKTAISAFDWFDMLLPPGAVNASFYTAGEDRAADEQVVAAVLPWLQTDSHQLILVHLDQVDYAGHHEGGPQDPRWNEAATRADDLIREIAAHMDPSQDTLLVLSDHGQIDSGGHGGDEAVVLTEPFVLAGAGVIPGDYGDIQMVDVVPTLAALLGVNIPAASQGQPLTAMLDLLPEHAAAVQQRSLLQQQLLLEHYAQAIDQPLEMPADPSVATYQDAMDKMRQERLARERLYRLVPGLIMVILPLFFLFRFGRTSLWLAGGALMYTLLFNSLYILKTSNTYSLSWVSSPQELLGTLAGLVSLCLFLSWLALFMMAGFFRLEPSQVASRTVGLMLCSVYLLSLPVIFSFVWNGAFTTWTLPHMRSTYLAFLSLLQIPVLVFAGLSLAGLAYLGLWLSARNRSWSDSPSQPA